MSGTESNPNRTLSGEAEWDPTSDPESASSTLSEGEVAGIAVGAAVGGIVVLVAVGLILRTLLVRDAKPMFTCLEKAPAEKNAPAVDKSAPAVDKNAPVDTNI